jgi:hypothetical protein
MYLFSLSSSSINILGKFDTLDEAKKWFIHQLDTDIKNIIRDNDEIMDRFHGDGTFQDDEEGKDFFDEDFNQNNQKHLVLMKQLIQNMLKFNFADKLSSY